MEIQINVSGLVLHGNLEVPKNNRALGILFLHGGGNSTSTRYLKIQQFFTLSGISSLAFDFRGCGKSGGVLGESNLLSRLQDAESALKSFKFLTGLQDEQIIIWGSSMGGHLACRLASSHLGLHSLILQSAAAYGERAETINFGKEFTSAISKTNSWESSQAFPNLSNYHGRTLIIYGSNDGVIPGQVKQLYRESARHSKHFIIQGCGHSLLRPESEVEKLGWESMLNLVNQFILNN